MSTFALDASNSISDIVGGLNYALANLGTINNTAAGNVLLANITTGEITTTSTNSSGYTNTTIVSYLYQYMDVKYSNSATGGSGFSSNSANKSYYGLYNTANTSISSNPADYQWYQVTGGFGTTKGLYYQTIGGRQVQFFPSNVAPTNSFVAVPDNTALNLDTVTSAQNNQIVNVNAYYQANIIPATPSGGTYNFTTFTLTAPAGWTSNIPSSANTSVYVSTAAFSGNSSATSVPPATSWTVPALYTSQFQGNTGPAGQRGFVPMGYVITASDPTTYSNAQFTTAYSSSRTNSSPPIGLGFSPIQYDTSQFAYQNLFTGNTITVVKQYDGTGWNTVVGNVISGGLFVPGSINANTLNANQVYALTISSTNADVGNVASNGFWMQSSNGDARLAGNTSIGNNLTVGQNAQIGANLNVGSSTTIGNNLTVGNNAVIGGNLTIGGLVTGGSLNANTVVTTNIVNQSVSFGNGVSTQSLQIYPTWTLLQNLSYDYAKPIITTALSTDTVYINGVISPQFGFAAVGQVYWYIKLYRINLGTSVTTNLLFTYGSFYNSYPGTYNYAIITPVSFLDTPGVGTFQYYMTLTPGFAPSPSSCVYALGIQNGALTCQILKR